LLSIALSSSNRLFLNQAEADRLADQIRQKLICRTATQANEPVVVADLSLTVAEAWRLIDGLVPIEDEVDWQNEGF